MTQYILSIDQGTTSCRAIVFDQNGKTIAIAQKEFTQFFPHPGWVEHDAEEILEVQTACIKDVVAQVGAENIACAGVTNQRETTVVWNKKTGKPVHKAIVWQCRRTQELAQALLDQTDLFREKTGLVPDAYFSGLKIRWILDNVDGARTAAEKGELLFGTIDTWLIWNLTKEQNHVTEPSNAARTMLFNIKELRWDEELHKHLKVPQAIMPKVISSNGNFGTTDADKTGLSVPIRADLGDQQAALFGQCCFEKGMGKCTYGTGSFLLTNIGSEMKIAPGLLTTIAWRLDNEKPDYAFEGAIFVAGAAIQWLRDGLKIIDSSNSAQNISESIDSNDGVYFVPALTGLGSPWWNSDVRGTIVGLTRGTSQAHFVRAAVESMAYSVADVCKGMSKNGVPIKELRVDGGATQNTFMLQLQTDLLNVPVLRSAQGESTAWGVAALAGLSVGLIKSRKEYASAWKSDLTLKPKDDRSTDYEGWLNALKGAFAHAGGQFSE